MSNKFETTPQWHSGSSVADFLDKFFRGRGWVIEGTTPHEERVLCIGDKKFRRDGKLYNVEYKSGIQTFYTGNVFLETVSVDSENKPGWVYTCKADFIAYGALLNGKILIFLPSKLRDCIEGLKTKFPTKKTNKGQNTGYDTHGVIVPLAYAEKHLAAKVLRIEAVKP